MNPTPKNNARRRASIDAKRSDCAMRFMNRSSNPTARFHEMSHGLSHLIVAAACQALAKGKELAVSYEKHLWFVCMCGIRACVHWYAQCQESP
ncbi:hypothetical protein PybrP1_006800 [[Pythium] brassicae (nom. inval.)]|nr:hypothetical protein PybrP1_006800 [[Pythium] brassicae (nom. inval.)]